jgi:hypothetical protein
MTTPSFSVVIAAYQAAATIGDAIASALAQTLPPLEVIVCDDASTDDLDGALAPYAGQVQLIRHRENRGEAGAKNSGARAASGDFVVILDADDTFLPSRLEALAELSKADPELDILTTDAWLEVDGTVVRRCYDATWSFAFEHQREEILRRNFIFGLAAVRRARLIGAGGFDENIRRTTDWDCWLRLILDGSRAGVVLEPLARYRLHRDSLSVDRLEMRRGATMTLAKARGHRALRPHEAVVLEQSLARYSRDVRVLEARQSLMAAAPDARSRLVGIVRDRDHPVRLRLLAGAGATAPRIAGRVLRRRAARSWTGASGIRIPA